MEAITLDPPAVATSRTELDLLSTPIQVLQDGVDWGDAAIEQALADSQRGSMAVGFRVPNRVITMPLRVQKGNGWSFAQARAALQAKVSLLQREGGWLKRQPKDTPLYADVVNATLKLSGNWLQAHQEIDHEAVLTLECLPDFYGEELDAGTGTTFTVKGDYPARCRIVLTNGGANNWKTMLYALRGRYASQGSYDQSSYNASSLTALDAATKTTVTGAASGANTIQHASLADDWTPVAGTDVSGNMMNHQGTYRVFARVRTPSAANSVRVRFGWDVGDLTSPTFNPSQYVPISGSWCLMDMGEIRIDKVPVGTHRWGGQFQAIGEGLTVQLDQLIFFNTDDAMGIAQAADSTNTLTGFSIRDPFNQTAGALNGKNLVTPGAQTWDTSGATNDFQVETTGKTATRTTGSDASAVQSGRIAVAGTPTFTDETVQADLKWSGGTAYAAYGLMVRYYDASNWIAAVILPNTGTIALIGKSGGSNLGGIPLPEGNVIMYSPNYLFSPWLQIQSVWYRIKAEIIQSTGTLRVWFGFKGYDLPSEPDFVYQNSILQTGGTMPNGKPGLYDAYTGGVTRAANYDNFLVKAPTQDAVVYPSRAIQLMSDGMFRQDSAGAAYGPVTKQYGDLPRLPVSGLEGRTIELLTRPSMGDLASQADASVEAPTYRTYYRPCYLFVPET